MFNLPPDLPPGDFSITTVIIGFVMSLWGACVSYLIKVKNGVLTCSVRDFFYEVAVCLFAGFMVFMLCVGVGIPMSISGAFAGLGGHFGARTLFLLKKVLFSRAEAWIKKGD